MLDTRELCGFADYFVICNAETDRQIEAIRDAIDSHLNKEGLNPIRQEGNSGSGWLLLDYGGLIVHIFTLAQRSYYQLDALWSGARPLLRIQ